MSESNIPMILKLAPLPRTQVGPFLILGVDKSATREIVEAAWAQRIIWARKGLIQTPLEDINWARDVLNDPRKTYPTIQIGTLIFNSRPEAGAKVTGDFNITFTNGIETASGRTVFGHFEAKVAQ